MKPEITNIPIASLASGDRLFLKLYTFVGHQPGKKVYIQANLHGAEIAGNAVIHELIKFFQQLEPEHLTGEIRMVPACNPMGMNERSHHFSSGRFNSYDGKDWNRIFWDYGRQAEDDLFEFAQINLTQDTETVQKHYRQSILDAFAALKEIMKSPTSVPFREKYRHHLQSLCLDVNYVIDLHSSTNRGLNYLYYFQNRSDSATHFLMPIGIELDMFDEDAFDEAFIRPWLELEEQFEFLGRNTQFDIEAYTLELGSGMTMNAHSIATGVEGIKNYLAHKHILHMSEYPVKLSPQPMRFTRSSNLERYYAPQGGLISTRVDLGQEVQQGQPLYELLCFSKEQDLPTTAIVVAKRDGLVFDVSTNEALNEGEYVLGLL
ncbi:MAG: succinylglutamate desuccinylase/aspartoacylase family protein [Cyanobacteria bacterium P01_A01_bin.37]